MFPKKPRLRSSHCGSAEMNLASIHEDSGSIPASLTRLRIQGCRELWCRSQTRLRSDVAVAVVSLAATAPVQPLAQEPPQAMGAALK